MSGPAVVVIEKERVYVDSPSEAPEDVEVHEGDEGGYYYYPSGSEEDGESGDSSDSGGSESDGTTSSSDLEEGDTVVFGGQEVEVFEVWDDGAINLWTSDGLTIIQVDDGEFDTPYKLTDEDGNEIQPSEPESDYEPPEDLSDHETEVSSAFETDDVNLEGVDQDAAADVLTEAAESDDVPDVRAVSTDIDELQAEIEDDVDAVASWNFVSRELYLNPDTFNDETAQRGHEQGWLVAESAEDMLWHEIGHAVVYANNSPAEVLNQEFDADEAELVFNEVSKMAATSPHEFAAEVYSGLMSGEDYSDEVMDLFDGVGGVRP